MQRIPLHLSYDASQDTLTAVEFGRVAKGQPLERWREFSDDVAYLLTGPGGREVGFAIKSYSNFDLDDPLLSGLREGPRFDVPALGMRDASAGDIAVAVPGLMGERSSVDRQLFKLAFDADGAVAARLWRECLQTGDMRAHQGLGYTLFDLGAYREAHRHFAYYAELAPGDPWAWCWLGRASHALERTQEAQAAYRRAIELSEAGSMETPAAQLMERLSAGESADLPEDGEQISTDDRHIRSTPYEYDFCRSSDGTLGRRRGLGRYGMVLCGEVYVPSLERWRLDEAVMAKTEWPTITEDEALGLAGDAGALHAPFPDPADLAPHGGPNNTDERLDWLDKAIATTLTDARSQEETAVAELPWARPGTWDYDYQIHAIMWISDAYKTLQRLFAEKQGLLSFEAMRASKSYGE